jgi:hypothetical protein
MPARRCAIACESWPNSPMYATCPLCGESTKTFYTADPSVTPEEARSIVLHGLFDTYYEEHCRKLGIPVEGPIPSEVLVGS